MIHIGVVPFLSSGFAKITKLYPCSSYFPRIFGHFESSAFFFKKWGEPHTKEVKQDIVIFYHISSVIDFSSKKYICSKGHKESWYLQSEFSEDA